jgi:hypothetical protein
MGVSKKPSKTQWALKNLSLLIGRLNINTGFRRLNQKQERNLIGDKYCSFPMVPSCLSEERAPKKILWRHTEPVAGKQNGPACSCALNGNRGQPNPSASDRSWMEEKSSVGNPKPATQSVKRWRQNETLSGILPARSACVPKREMKTGTEDRDRALGSMNEQEPGSIGVRARGCLHEQESWVASVPPARCRIKTRTGKANGNQAPELHTGDENQNEIRRQTRENENYLGSNHDPKTENSQIRRRATRNNMQNKIFPLGSTQDYSTELKRLLSVLTHLIIGMKIYS